MSDIANLPAMTVRELPPAAATDPVAAGSDAQLVDFSGVSSKAARFEEILGERLDALGELVVEEVRTDVAVPPPVLITAPGLPRAGKDLPPSTSVPGATADTPVLPGVPATANVVASPQLPAAAGDPTRPAVEVAAAAPAGGAGSPGAGSSGETGSGALPGADPAAVDELRSSTALRTESSAPAQVGAGQAPPPAFAPRTESADARSARQLPSAELPANPGSPRWNDGLADRVAWMVDRQHQVAELRLTPPELGRVEVRISVNGNEASIQFNTSQPGVRDAIEQALPRLREMFADSGMQLANADVSDQGRPDRDRDEPSAARVADSHAEDPAAVETTSLHNPTRVGLLDHYA